jgi:uncharacterized membrane protein YqgA involved in biofilm formation
MFPGVGTIINIITIIGGASLGVLVGNRMPTRTRTLLTDVLGLITLLGAASARVEFACRSWFTLDRRFDWFGIKT